MLLGQRDETQANASCHLSKVKEQGAGVTLGMVLCVTFWCVKSLYASLRVSLQQPIGGFWPWAPGFAGSRSGALIATAWASMVHLGTEGYLRVTAQIMQAQPSSLPFATCLCNSSAAASVLRKTVHVQAPTCR